MSRRFTIGLLMATSVWSSMPVGGQAESIPELEESYLQKAVEADHAEVVLGQLALQKASNDQVKQYAARMIQDHQRASDETHKLTSVEGTPMPSQLSMPHQQIQEKLSHLSAQDFDKAYMSFMIQDHMRNVRQLQQHAQTLTDPRTEHSTAGTLRLLKDHLEQAKVVAATVGVNENEVSQLQDYTAP
jgi:putative membrane protein